MALGQPSTFSHSLPVIVLLAVCPILFVLAVIYYLIIYPLRKERRRREKQAQTDEPSVNTGEAPRRDLHRWIPTLPTPTTPRFSPGPLSTRSRPSGYSFQTGSLSTSQSAPSTRSLHPESRPTSELDMLPISDMHISAAPPPTPPPSAFISPHGVGRVRPLPQPLQDPFSDPKPFSDPDPFSRPGPSYVRGGSAGWDVHAAAAAQGHEHANISPVSKGVIPPPPAASTCSSADGASITTSSTLPPSYRTHRPTHRTASDVPFSDHERRSDRSQTATSTGEHAYGAGSHPARSDRRSRYYPRRSVDGGVRLEGGPVDPATGRGPGKPPRYRQKV